MQERAHENQRVALFAAEIRLGGGGDPEGIDPHAIGNVRGHATDHGSVALSEDLHAVELPPCRWLMAFEPLALRIRQKPP